MRGRLLAIAVAGLLALPALAPSAQADYEPVAAGSTKLTLDRGFLGLLRQSGVKLRVAGGARLAGGRVTFPVVGGKFDPTTDKGTVEHRGALILTAGRKSLPLKDLQLKTTQRRSPFSVKAGGGQLKLAEVGRIAVARRGFGEQVKVADLTLGPNLATRLAKKLGLRGVIAAGQPLGRTLTRVQPQTVAVLGQGRAALTFDPGFATKLASLFVAVNPVFPAERPGAEFTLPIAGGSIAPDASTGTLETGGALEFLQLGGGQAIWTEPWLDLAAKTASAEVNVQPSPPYGGKVGRVGVAGLASLGAGVAADSGARTIAVQGAALTLDAGAAATFNEAFAKPQGKDGVFVPGEALGSLSFTARGQ